MARLRSAAALAGLMLCACATISYASRDGRLWHPRHAVGVPDLVRRGWERIQLPDADLAFRRDGVGVIAVRVRCPGPGEAIPLRWEARRLWLGIPRGSVERFHLDVDGYEGVSMSADAKDLKLRTLVVRTESCSLDVAQVAPLASPHEQVFEEFIAEIRLGEEEP